MEHPNNSGISNKFKDTRSIIDRAKDFVMGPIVIQVLSDSVSKAINDPESPFNDELGGIAPFRFDESTLVTYGDSKETVFVNGRSLANVTSRSDGQGALSWVFSGTMPLSVMEDPAKRPNQLGTAIGEKYNTLRPERRFITELESTGKGQGKTIGQAIKEAIESGDNINHAIAIKSVQSAINILSPNLIPKLIEQGLDPKDVAIGYVNTTKNHGWATEKAFRQSEEETRLAVTNDERFKKAIEAYGNYADVIVKAFLEIPEQEDDSGFMNIAYKRTLQDAEEFEGTEEDKQAFIRGELRNTVWTVLISATETNKASIIESLYHIANMEKDSQKAFLQYFSEEYTNHSIEQKNPRVTSTVMEVLRLARVVQYIPGTISVPGVEHGETITLERNGYAMEIPNGTPVISWLSHILANPEIFENPGDFDPRRFLTLSPETNQEEITNEEFKRILAGVFYFGKHQCPGYPLAFELIASTMAEIAKWLLEEDLTLSIPFWQFKNQDNATGINTRLFQKLNVSKA